MNADELDFELPQELIAQEPAARREASRLLHFRGGVIEHRNFVDLPGLLRRGDLLVFNDTKVLPARFMLRKRTGGRIEGLFLNQIDAGRWRVMLKNLGRYRGELVFEAAENLRVRAVRVLGDGQYEIEVGAEEPAESVLSRIGRMPLPPYIRRAAGADPHDEEDRRRYQTVYARQAGSVAAPTAGLHFTPEIMAALEAAGVQTAFVTLHVGLGTFKPITADKLDGHVMHSEHFEITAEAAEILNRAEIERRRIIAVGTTSARVLESHPAGEPWRELRGETDIFIYPPYSWRRVSGLVSNFHLPRSTLIALVAALIGLEEQRRVYAEAISHRYRFFSYGDAMLAER
ncbi:MAG TPA: tRNA preQ1(34) S-adenosylmethionine ribosyltransferase-isomerase QueA [Tepidisphaeraceae bacterium]|nr:tRNA preQ1(34) S-adenosylmethionine ribosyltransferase-isomerase QueA [Tepidisphaeraceae bacterium]